VTAGELALVVAAVLCVLAFAALVVTLVRMRDALGELRTEVASLRTTTEEAAATTAAHLAEARRDLDRFDRLVGSAESISDAVDRSSRVARAAMSTPMIKAAGLATGTSRAVKRLRSSS
jgi:methyl-accepting chemotaxis protein